MPMPQLLKIIAILLIAWGIWDSVQFGLDISQLGAVDMDGELGLILLFGVVELLIALYKILCGGLLLAGKNLGRSLFVWGALVMWGGLLIFSLVAFFIQPGLFIFLGFALDNPSSLREMLWQILPRLGLVIAILIALHLNPINEFLNQRSLHQNKG